MGLMWTRLFDDRADAGRALARALTEYADRDDVVVLALPRGGVPVAFEVASRLRCPLDVLTVRKLGAPGRRELAMGAIASGGIRVVNDEVVGALCISQASLDAAAEREGEELARRERAYRGDRPPLEVRDRTVILIDDGLATGSTMRAAVAALRTRNPARVVVAVPTAAADSLESLRSQADEVVALATPEPYVAVGVWYGSFEQTGDEEVRSLLEAARGALAPSVGSREVG
jgi:putative phosphoribosyl transferase